MTRHFNIPPSGIIAEIKFASPSLGDIYKGKLNHVQIAQEYIENGASALSVLTEPTRFKGDIRYISDIREKFPDFPILQKDFISTEKKILQAYEHGASAILLIVTHLQQLELSRLYEYALSLGLTPLVEVHSLEEIKRALMIQPTLIGVNNRNLNTLSIDLQISRDCIPHIPSSIKRLSLSGIHCSASLNEMRGLGFDGFLIGSHFMKHEHPGLALRALLEASIHES